MLEEEEDPWSSLPLRHMIQMFRVPFGRWIHLVVLGVSSRLDSCLLWVIDPPECYIPFPPHPSSTLQSSEREREKIG